MKLRLPQRFANQLSRQDFSRNTKLLLAISTLSSISYMGLFMLLRSLYILRLGRDAEYLGVYYLVGSATYMLMGIPSGALSKRFGLKPILLLGTVLMGLGMLSFPFSEYVSESLHYVWPLVSQSLLTMGWSMLNVNLVPALSAVTDVSGHRAAYSLNSALRQTGMLVGTFIGGWLPSTFGALTAQTLDSSKPYGMALWIGALLCFTALLPLSKLKFRTKKENSTTAQRIGSAPWIIIGALAVYVYVRHAGWATCQAFCNPYMDEGLQLSTSLIGTLTSAGQIASIFASLLVSRWIDRTSTRRILVFTSIGIMLSLLTLGLFPSWIGAGIGRLGVLVFSAMWMPALQIFQVESVAPEWRSLAYGAISMAMGSGFGTASYGGGYIISTWGYNVLFLVGAGVSVISLLVLQLVASKHTKAPSPE